MIRMLWAAAVALVLAACTQPQQQAAPAPVNPPSEQAAPGIVQQARISDEDRAALENVVRRFLGDAQTHLAPGMRPAPGIDDHIVALQPGRDDRWQVQLAGGTPYRVLGGCDNECSNVDMELIDASGSVVASDLLPDDAPVVNFTPAASGTFTVRLLMQTCTLAPCFAGARVLTN